MFIIIGTAIKQEINGTLLEMRLQLVILPYCKICIAVKSSFVAMATIKNFNLVT